MDDDGQHKSSNSQWWWTKHIILNPQLHVSAATTIRYRSKSNIPIMSIPRSNTKQCWKKGLAVVLVIIIIIFFIANTRVHNRPIKENTSASQRALSSQGYRPNN